MAWLLVVRDVWTPLLFLVFALATILIGARLTMRMATLLLIGLPAVVLIPGLTTTGPEFVRASVQHLRVPYRFGYTALAAYRFVPRFRHDLDLIRQAHRVRGVAGGRGPIAGIRRAFGYVVPPPAGVGAFWLFGAALLVLAARLG